MVSKDGGSEITGGVKSVVFHHGVMLVICHNAVYVYVCVWVANKKALSARFACEEERLLVLLTLGWPLGTAAARKVWSTRPCPPQHAKNLWLKP